MPAVTRESAGSRQNSAGIGYHPSLPAAPPRHRPRSSGPSRKAIRSPAAPSYHLADRMDAGADRRPGVGLRQEGRDPRGNCGNGALAPLGYKLLGDVIDYAKAHKSLPAKPQDEQFATRAPAKADAKH